MRLVTLVFLDVDNLGRFGLFFLVLFCFLFVTMLSTVSLVMEESMMLMGMERLFETVGMFIPRVAMGMVMGMAITEIVGMGVLVRVSTVSRRSLLRMDYLHPRFTQVALKRVGPWFVAMGTVLTRFLIFLCARKINQSARGSANAAKAHERTLHVNAGAGLTFQDDLHG